MVGVDEGLATVDGDQSIEDGEAMLQDEECIIDGEDEATVDMLVVTAVMAATVVATVEEDTNHVR